MRAARIGVLVVVFGTGLLVARVVAARNAEPTRSDAACGSSAKSRVRTTLYFGLSRPKGSVSELEWQLFLRDEVTKRFPDGFTVWQAEGQWQTPAGSIDREQSKVLLLVHPDTTLARQSVQAVIQAYRTAFDQESVLWESSRVCAAA